MATEGGEKKRNGKSAKTYITFPKELIQKQVVTPDGRVRPGAVLPEGCKLMTHTYDASGERSKKRVPTESIEGLVIVGERILNTKFRGNSNDAFSDLVMSSNKPAAIYAGALSPEGKMECFWQVSYADPADLRSSVRAVERAANDVKWRAEVAAEREERAKMPGFRAVYREKSTQSLLNMLEEGGDDVAVAVSLPALSEAMEETGSRADRLLAKRLPGISAAADIAVKNALDGIGARIVLDRHPLAGKLAERGALAAELMARTYMPPLDATDRLERNDAYNDIVDKGDDTLASIAIFSREEVKGVNWDVFKATMSSVDEKLGELLPEVAAGELAAEEVPRAMGAIATPNRPREVAREPTREQARPGVERGNRSIAAAGRTATDQRDAAAAAKGGATEHRREAR